MSYPRTETPPEVVLGGIACLVLLFIAFKIAKSTGADFMVILTACSISAVWFISAFLLVWFGRYDLDFKLVIILVSLSLCLIWPTWFPVLESASENLYQATLWGRENTSPWWNTRLFKWGIEGLLMGCTGFLIYRRWSY